jgi:tail lysozyme
MTDEQKVCHADGYWLMERLREDFQLSKAAAAGFAGNLHHECNGFRTLQEVKPTVKGSRGGYGWAQWTGPRRREFESWAADHKLRLASREANYGFLKHELEGSERKVISKLKGVVDAGQAASIICNTYLRPGVPHLEKRKALARSYFA